MPEPYIGEIRIFAGSFPPAGWAFCAGQTIPISENDALFTLIGTTYGGDGQETFNLPDLQGRVPIHQGTLGGNTYTLGEKGGVESVTLTTQQMPTHSHPFLATTNNASSSNAQSNVLAQTPTVQLYINDVASFAMDARSIGPVGGSQPHENMQPFLCINFIISLFGVFPTQT